MKAALPVVQGLVAQEVIAFALMLPLRAIPAQESLIPHNKVSKVAKPGKDISKP